MLCDSVDYAENVITVNNIVKIYEIYCILQFFLNSRYQHSSTSLSAALRESLSKDLLTPVLNEECLEAVDRRVEIVLREIRKCIAKNTINNVIIPV